jgi:hypothetical protein
MGDCNQGPLALLRQGEHAVIRRPILIVFVSLLVATLACSLNTASDNEDSPNIEAIQTEPLVLLLAPINGSIYAEGAQIELHAVALDSGDGVARIEFRVDDTPVGEVEASQSTGDESLDAVVSWVATGQTGHLITVEAFRADGSSLGFRDTGIKVVSLSAVQLPTGSSETNASPSPAATGSPELSETSEPQQNTVITPTADQATATPQPTSGNASSGGQPTALVNAATLNVRQGPGTNYPTVGTLSQGDRVEIVGRNTDSTWWAINFSSGTAWIFAALTTAQGNLSQIPLVAPPPAPVSTSAPAATSAPQGAADLVIDNVRLDPATPTAGETFTVYAVVRNAGQSPSPEADAMLTFQPGDERSPADPRIPALQPGASKEVFFRVTLREGGTGLTGVIEVDIYNAVNEGQAGEGNNTKSVTYNVNS